MSAFSCFQKRMASLSNARANIDQAIAEREELMREMENMREQRKAEKKQSEERIRSLMKQLDASKKKVQNFW